MMKIKLRPPEVAEIIFDIAYLIFAITAGIILIVKGGGNPMVTAYGVLALTLGGGDAFHLLPRVYSIYTGTMEQHVKILGFGKLVTSVTMTLFYVILYYMWQALYQKELPLWLTIVVLFLGILRIMLCMNSQNKWFEKNPPLSFAVYRNIPFVILGGIVAALFAMGGADGYRDGFAFMCPAIILSFGFYLAVVLFAGKYKKIGMLMLPKTCTYVWIICMGFSLL